MGLGSKPKSEEEPIIESASSRDVIDPVVLGQIKQKIAKVHEPKKKLKTKAEFLRWLMTLNPDDYIEQAPTIKFLHIPKANNHRRAGDLWDLIKEFENQ